MFQTVSHTSTEYFLLVRNVLSVLSEVAICGVVPLLLLASTFLPWRMAPNGQGNGYPVARYWSLYTIKGMKKTNYIDNYEIACHVSTRLIRYSLLLSRRALALTLTIQVTNQGNRYCNNSFYDLAVQVSCASESKSVLETL